MTGTPPSVWTTTVEKHSTDRPEEVFPPWGTGEKSSGLTGVQIRNELTLEWLANSPGLEVLGSGIV